MRNFSKFSAAILSAAVFTSSLPAASADAADLQALRDQVRALEQQIQVLARQIGLREEAAAAATSTAPKITINDKGLTVASADAANSIKLRGLVQLDNRLFFNDGGGIANSAFILRRARLIAEGVFAKNFSFQLVPEFGGGAVSIVDANFGITLNKALSLKFGKFKSPVGLELLQSDTWTFFNERSIVTNLVPNRDLGVQASGDLFDGTLNYAVGVFNGLGDGGSSNNADFDNEKDAVARLIASPFKNSAGSPLQALSFGLAASYGREKTAAGRTGGYRTDGQQTFFSYSAATVADGPNWRLSPQLDYRQGPLGVLGEYVVSAVNVRTSPIAPTTELQNKAWQLAAGYVLTGEASSYAGVAPRTNFDLAAGTWGAFELTGRYASLKVDDAAFPTYASSAASAQEATSFGLGLNWYLSKAVHFKIDYYQTKFDFAAGAPAVTATPILRQDEKAFVTRFQLAF